MGMRGGNEGRVSPAGHRIMRGGGEDAKMKRNGAAIEIENEIGIGIDEPLRHSAMLAADLPASR